eukprot:6742423-Prymnesium_polylepis.1
MLRQNGPNRPQSGSPPASGPPFRPPQTHAGTLPEPPPPQRPSIIHPHMNATRASRCASLLILLSYSASCEIVSRSTWALLSNSSVVAQ